MQEWMIWVIVAVLFGAVFILPMFTRKKQQGQLEQMLKGIAVGDKVKTVGGVVGIVVRVDEISPVDREFVIETGDTIKSQIRFDINALYMVMQKSGAPAAENNANELYDIIKNNQETPVAQEEPVKEEATVQEPAAQEPAAQEPVKEEPVQEPAVVEETAQEVKAPVKTSKPRTTKSTTTKPPKY